MTEYVVDNTGDDRARGVDLVDGDQPPVRLIVHGDLPTTIEHEGRTWIATGEADQESGAMPIAVFRPAY